MSATATKTEKAPFCVDFPTTDKEPSWYGPGRSAGEFAVGYGDTSILLESGATATAIAFIGESDCDPVNGLAFAGSRLAIASPEMLRITSVDAITGPANRLAVAHSHFGVHDLVAGRSGAFYASAGPNGILFSPPSDHRGTKLYTFRDESVPAYIYHSCVLHQPDGSEIIVSAARKDGVVAQQIFPMHSGRAGRVHAPDNLTIVDVCPLGLAAFPRGVLAVADDGTTVLIADVFSDDAPVARKPEAGLGKAYRIFSVRGHLCLLTSKVLQIYRGQVRKMAGSGNGPSQANILSVPLEAVDAAAAWDRWLAVIVTDSLQKFDLSLLDTVKQKSSGRVNGAPKPLYETDRELSEVPSRWAARNWEPQCEPSELVAG